MKIVCKQCKDTYEINDIRTKALYLRYCTEACAVLAGRNLKWIERNLSMDVPASSYTHYYPQGRDTVDNEINPNSGCIDISRLYNAYGISEDGIEEIIERIDKALPLLRGHITNGHVQAYLIGAMSAEER